MDLEAIFTGWPEDSGEAWRSHPQHGHLFCQDESSGLRRYLVSGRQFDEVVPSLFVGPEHWDYRGLRSMVEAVVDLRRMIPEDRETIRRQAALAGLEYANFGFEDGCLPTEALLQDALTWLESRPRAGASGLVHCAAGISRSPFVVTLYLLPRFGWNLEEAAQHLARRRREARPARIYLDYLRRWASREKH